MAGPRHGALFSCTANRSTRQRAALVIDKREAEVREQARLRQAKGRPKKTLDQMVQSSSASDAKEPHKPDQRIGEILRELPTRQGKRNDLTSVDTPTKVRHERNNHAPRAVHRQQRRHARPRKPYDRSALVLQLEPLYAAEAKRRMSEGGGDRKSGSQKSANPISGTARTDEQLAKLAGTSRDTIRNLKLEEKEIVARQAKERQRAAGGDHGNQYTGGKMAVAPNLAQAADEGRTLEILARDIPMGHEGLRGLGDPLTGEPPKSHAT